MAASKNNFFDHVKLLRKSAADNGADLLIDGDSVSALIRRGNAFIELKPHFIATVDGKRQYVDRLVDEAWQFVGWQPYRNKRWPLASDKLTFKRFAAECGLNVPPLITAPYGPSEGVVVKRVSSSFGEQVKGPFRDAKDCQLNIAEGEYYEKFIAGRLLKIWFWNETPVCAELDSMPVVVGDGVQNLRDLILRRVRLNVALGRSESDRLLRRAATVLRYFNTELSTVLAYGHRQVVEFRYGSLLMVRQDRHLIDFSSLPESGAEWTKSVANIGQFLYAGIPASIRAGTLFTVDAIVDEADQVWLLEMNSNPAVHPLVYRSIVSDMLASADARAGTSIPSVNATGNIPTAALA